jgi:phosphoglucomutase
MVEPHRTWSVDSRSLRERPVRPRGWTRLAGYKIYAESFLDDEHLGRLIEEAQAMVSAALDRAG